MRSDPPNVPPSGAHPIPATLPPSPHVLVVDDAEDTRQMYEIYLDYVGFQVTSAGDGAEAVAKANEGLPHVILLDLTLPVMDGPEAARRLKASPRTAHIPIVALTGKVGVDAAAVSCDALLVKPCSPDEMVDTLREMIVRSSSQRTSGQSAVFRRDAPAALPAVLDEERAGGKR
jgi:CheY-like chemotaxis protein